MKVARIFENNRTQAVRLPVEFRFPESVKQVHVRVLGQERVISPVGASWDSFFSEVSDTATSDFIPESLSPFVEVVSA